MYLHDWAGGGKFAMVMDFEGVYMTEAEFNAAEAPYQNKAYWLENRAKAAAALAEEKYDVEVLLATYSYRDYSGDAFVLFRKDGKLYEVSGGHCSCNGLEGQWSPEETTKEALLTRLGHGRFGNSEWSGNEFATELRSVLESLS